MDGDAKELRLSGKRKENFTEFTSMNTIRKRMPKAQNSKNCRTIWKRKRLLIGKRKDIGKITGLIWEDVLCQK